MRHRYKSESIDAVGISHLLARNGARRMSPRMSDAEREADILGSIRGLPVVTQTSSWIIRLVVRSEYKRGMPNRWRLLAS
jgi:hypothetical protein